MNRIALACLLFAAACGKGDKADEPGAAPKRHHSVGEAADYLNALAKHAKVYYAENAKFPIGKAKLLPADWGSPGCCGGPANANQCAVTNEWATDPVWKALEFRLDEPSSYRYGYESSDGKTFTATATGDTDCDGVDATFTLTGTVDATGNPTVNLERPPNGKY